MELATGLEWSWSREVTTSVEVGLAYSQVITTYPVYPPPPEPLDRETLPQVQTTATTWLGLTLRIGITFYLPR